MIEVGICGDGVQGFFTSPCLQRLVFREIFGFSGSDVDQGKQEELFMMASVNRNMRCLRFGL